MGLIIISLLNDQGGDGDKREKFYKGNEHGVVIGRFFLDFRGKWGRSNLNFLFNIVCFCATIVAQRYTDD